MVVSVLPLLTELYHILAILPGYSIIVLDCVVTHPAATSYVQGASHWLGLQQQRLRLMSVAHLNSSVMVRAMNSCCWLVMSLLEGFIKRQPASSLALLR